MRKLFICLFVMFLFLSKGQTWSWAQGGYGALGDEGQMICSDSKSNQIIVGAFHSTLITFGSYSLSNGGNWDIYLVKYDSNGNIKWAKKAGGVGDDWVSSVATDQNGNIFISGFFYSPTCTFGTNTVSCAGNADIFVAKYDSSGNNIWVKSFGGAYYDVSSSISVDTLGFVYAGGNFVSPSVNFGAYTFTQTLGFGGTVFLTKFNTDGDVLWAKSSSQGQGGVYSVANDLNCNVIICGSFYDLSFSLGAITLTCGNTSNPKAFVAKYDSTGNILWAKSALQQGNEALSVTADKEGNAYITGYFSGPVITFSPVTLNNSGQYNSFLTKCDPNGNVVWGRAVNSPYNVSFCVRGDLNSVYICGGAQFPVTLNTLVLPNTFGPGNDPMFIARYDLSGNIICAASLNDGGDDESGLSTDNQGNAYVTGDFGSSSLIAGTQTLILTGIENIFTAKLTCPISVGVPEIERKEWAQIYPNPTKNDLTIEFENNFDRPKGVTIIDVAGRVVKQIDITTQKQKISLEDLSSGCYYLHAQNSSGLKFSGKVIKN